MIEILLLLVAIPAVYIAIQDQKTRIISDRANSIVLALALLGTLALSFSNKNFYKFMLAWLVALGVFLALYCLAILSRGAIGGGDIKFAPSLSAALAWVSPTSGVWFLVLAFQIAALVALYQLIVKRRSLKQRIAFGPFLALGYLLIATWLLAV